VLADKPEVLHSSSEHDRYSFSLSDGRLGSELR
jgi:hypothetical protein